jgi:hypothetical protein
LHGLHLAALNCGISLTIYILVSLLTPDEHFDLEALLHRPPRKEKDAVKEANKLRNKFFTTPLSIGLWIFALVHTVVVIIVAWYNFTYAVNLESWVVFYKYFLLIFFFWSIPVTLIFIIFGTRDLIRLLRGIEKEQVDVADDGQVH